MTNELKCPLCHGNGILKENQFVRNAVCSNLDCPILTFNDLWSPTK